MSETWVKWHGYNVCPVEKGVLIKVQFRDGAISSYTGDATALRWSHQYNGSDIVGFGVGEHEVEAVAEPVHKPHSHYHKDVSKYDSVDVYRVLDLFGVTDQAIGHAAKKLLCAGQRGHKDLATDVQNVIDTLERWKEMQTEDMKCG